MPKSNIFSVKKNETTNKQKPVYNISVQGGFSATLMTKQQLTVCKNQTNKL